MPPKKTAKKTTAKKQPGMFVQGDRPKLDIRVSQELDARIEKAAAKLGTTKNSVVVVGAAMFVKKLEGMGSKPDDDDLKEALRELSN